MTLLQGKIHDGAITLAAATVVSCEECERGTVISATLTETDEDSVAAAIEAAMRREGWVSKFCPSCIAAIPTLICNEQRDERGEDF